MNIPVFRINIWMPDFGIELNMGRLDGIIGWDQDVNYKHTTLIRCILWPINLSFQMVIIFWINDPYIKYFSTFLIGISLLQFFQFLIKSLSFKFFRFIIFCFDFEIIVESLFMTYFSVFEFLLEVFTAVGFYIRNI